MKKIDEWYSFAEKFKKVAGKAEEEAEKRFRAKPPEWYDPELTVFVELSDISYSQVTVTVKFYNNKAEPFCLHYHIPMSFFMEV